VPLPPADTRPLFRPLTGDIIRLLRTLTPEDWQRPTLAGTWRVRDVVAHLIDTALRRLSAGRDGVVLSTPGRPITNERELTAFINELNASWVRATRSLSTRVLVDLYAHVASDLSEYFERASLDEPARFPVSWAGDQESPAWFDIGRELTEIWHHGAQIRDAIGAGPFPDPRWLRAVLDMAVRGLPHAFRNVGAWPGASIQLDITGPSGGTWILAAMVSGWDLSAGTAVRPATIATMTDETAWRLLFNAMPHAEAESMIRLTGDIGLGRPLLAARSVIV
jgi:uncharacterized protein (TIGR03083 family)